MSTGISVEHPVAHVHTQNGLAESFIKCLQLIARPLLMKSKLPISAWGHVSHPILRIKWDAKSYVRPEISHTHKPTNYE